MFQVPETLRSQRSGHCPFQGRVSETTRLSSDLREAWRAPAHQLLASFSDLAPKPCLHACHPPTSRKMAAWVCRTFPTGACSVPVGAGGGGLPCHVNKGPGKRVSRCLRKTRSQILCADSAVTTAHGHRPTGRTSACLCRPQGAALRFLGLI